MLHSKCDQDMGHIETHFSKGKSMPRGRHKSPDRDDKCHSGRRCDCDRNSFISGNFWKTSVLKHDLGYPIDCII